MINFHKGKSLHGGLVFWKVDFIPRKGKKLSKKAYSFFLVLSSGIPIDNTARNVRTFVRTLIG
jgi:hypothetical protein